jgi:hypothetical protein
VVAVVALAVAPSVPVSSVALVASRVARLPRGGAVSFVLVAAGAVPADVSSALAGGPGSSLAAWPGGPAPAAVPVGGSSVWFAVACAVAVGLPVVVFAPSSSWLPSWPGVRWRLAAWPFAGGWFAELR